MSDYMSLLLDETRRFFHAVVEAQDESLGRAGLTPGERRLLETLARERTLVTATALARRTLTTVSEIVPGLRSLNERGWLESSSCASNRRWTESVGLSDEGRDAWRALQAGEQQLLEKLAEVLDEQHARLTLTTLRQLRRTLQRSTTAVTPLAFRRREPSGSMHCGSLPLRPVSPPGHECPRVAVRAR